MLLKTPDFGQAVETKKINTEMKVTEKIKDKHEESKEKDNKNPFI